MSLTLHTSLGDLKIELECERSPKLCENFLALAASGTYDGTRFHRNIASFLVQGGDPTGTGKGGESIHGGPMQDEPSGLSHNARGVVAMASQGPGTIGSQFYITYARQPTLDGKYCVIGHLLPNDPTGGAPGDAEAAKLDNSWGTLARMEAVPVQGKKHVPVTDIVLHRVTIHANPFASR